jgi:hypothetical protein
MTTNTFEAEMDNIFGELSTEFASKREINEIFISI